MKLFLSLLLASAFMLAINCDDESDTAGFLGTWQGTSEEDGMNFTYILSGNNSYSFSAESDGEVVEQQTGSWSMDGSEITFTPTNCQSNEETDELSTVDCSEGFSVSVPDSGAWTLTAGSYGELEFTQ